MPLTAPDTSTRAAPFKLSADQGTAVAQFNYALLLANGDGIGQSKSLAAHYFTLSAYQGDAAQ
jgi:TPR repeat protein